MTNASIGGGAGLQRALADTNKLVELAPRLSIGYNNRAQVYIYLAQYANAIRDLEVAVKLEPGDSTAVCNMAIPLRQSGNKAAAQQWLNRCYAMDASQKQYYDGFMAAQDYRDELSRMIRASTAGVSDGERSRLYYRARDAGDEKMQHACIWKLSSCQ